VEKVMYTCNTQHRNSKQKPTGSIKWKKCFDELSNY
jgi:hypothetical protein